MPDIRKRLVVALGGNAISAPGKVGDIDEQFAQVSQTAEVLCDAIERGYHLIVTHGNGPQVGNILRRVELARSELYPIPLEVCVADTQAGMGYMIAQCLSNVANYRNLTCDVTAVVTTVLVDPNDVAFQSADKAIGPGLTAAQAETHRTKDGWQLRDEGGGRFRRVVPSPSPRKIIELPAIDQLVNTGQIVVCCGGGGIPVAVDELGRLRGVAAVIDKDRTTGLLARHLQAPTLVILTAVKFACINFGKADEQRLETVTADEAEKHLNAGQFGAGSMRPKIETGIDFVRQSPHADAVAIIAHVDKFADALDAKSGTRIVAG
ncbi:MAG TPA: carbamate kinase [Lacipirellulaceae bacterium]|jgi:carbamate kinase|nr:carbamate kinase [Lacipirellulaceae bacterium]